MVTIRWSGHTHPSMEDVRAVLAQALNGWTKVPMGKASDGATVDAELRMVSVAFVELQVAIEDYYNIEIDPIEVERGGGEIGAIAG